MRRGFRQQGGGGCPRRASSSSPAPFPEEEEGPAALGGPGPERPGAPLGSAGPCGHARLAAAVGAAASPGPAGPRSPGRPRAALPAPPLLPGEAGVPAGLLPGACQHGERRSSSGLSLCRRPEAGCCFTIPVLCQGACSVESCWQTRQAPSHGRADQSARCVLLPLGVSGWF